MKKEELKKEIPEIENLETNSVSTENTKRPDVIETPSTTVNPSVRSVVPKEPKRR